MLGLDFKASGFQRLKSLRGFGFWVSDLGLGLGSEVLGFVCCIGFVLVTLFCRAPSDISQSSLHPE